MSTDEAEVERQAGIDMVPIVESFEANLGQQTALLALFPPLGAQRSSRVMTLPEMVMSASETKGTVAVKGAVLTSWKERIAHDSYHQ